MDGYLAKFAKLQKESLEGGGQERTQIQQG